MSHCQACSAEFGVKFAAYRCLSCQHEHCKAHLIPVQNLRIDQSLMQTWHGGAGLCFKCILLTWGSDDDALRAPRGMFGRFRQIVGTSLGGAARLAGLRRDPKALLAIDSTTFADFSRARAFAMLRHQRVPTNEEIMRDLADWARLFAITQGRGTERELCLNDVFHLVDWLRTEPPFPKALLGLNWSIIERSPQYMALAADVLHVTRGAFAMMSAGATEVAYRVTDRAIEHFTGKSSIEFAYDKLKHRLGMNVNVRVFVIYWFVGQIIMQLLARRDE